MPFSLGSFSLEDCNNSQAPKYFPRGRNARQALFQCLFRSADIIPTEFHQSQRKVILVVIRVAANRVLKNVRSPRGIAKMRLDVSEQSKKGAVLLTLLRHLFGGSECLGVGAFAEVGVG